MSLRKIKYISLVVNAGLGVKKVTTLPAYLAHVQPDLAHLLGKSNRKHRDKMCVRQFYF